MVASDEYISTLDEDHVSSLSDGQEKLISLLPIIPSALSILGSAVIIKLIHGAKRKSPYRRILLGLSCSDIISSIGWTTQAFLMPSDTSQWIWAIGNEATCTVQGAVTQFGLSSHWYSGLLSFYFLFTVRYSIPQQKIERLEPCLHTFIVLFSLCTAISGTIIGLYNQSSLGPGCWVKDYPDGCGVEPDFIPCRSILIAWIFGGLPSILMLLSIMINNILIYCHVRGTVLRGVRHSSIQKFGSSSGSVDSSRNSHSSGVHRRPRSTASSLMASQLQRVKDVGTQSFLYVGAYAICNAWTYILKILESMDYNASSQDALMPLLILQAIFAPALGFFNGFIFIRPQYLRVRLEAPTESRFWCFLAAVKGYGNGGLLSTKSNLGFTSTNSGVRFSTASAYRARPSQLDSTNEHYGSSHPNNDSNHSKDEEKPPRSARVSFHLESDDDDNISDTHSFASDQLNTSDHVAGSSIPEESIEDIEDECSFGDLSGGDLEELSSASPPIRIDMAGNVMNTNELPNTRNPLQAMEEADIMMAMEEENLR